MTRFLFILFIFVQFQAFSQQGPKFGYIGPFHADLDWILVDKGNVDFLFANNDPSNSLDKREFKNGDTTVLTFGNDSTIKRKMTFKAEPFDSNKPTCDFDQLIFTDKTSAELYINKVLRRNRSGWKMASETVYYAKYAFRKMMILDNNKVTYRHHNLTSKEFKAATKKK